MSDHQLAAIAVCPDVTGGAFLSVTLVSGPLNEPQLANPVEHKLQAHTPEAVASAVSRIVTNIGDPTASIALSLPVALAWHHKQRYNDAIGNIPGAHIWRTSPHSNPSLLHFANDFPDSHEPVDVLFLTPGHAAASLRSVKADDGQVLYTGPTEEPTIAETDPSQELSPQDLIDKLITPTINPSSSTHPDLRGIHIFRPGGSCSALSSALQSKFPGTPIKWVSLPEISSTTATMLHREMHKPKEILCALLTVVPLNIALADGRLVPAVPRNWFLPLKRTVVLTTSGDGRSSATVAFVNGTKALGAVVLKGLAARPRGAARIEVSVEIGGVEVGGGGCARGGMYRWGAAGCVAGQRFGWLHPRGPLRPISLSTPLRPQDLMWVRLLEVFPA